MIGAIGFVIVVIIMLVFYAFSAIISSLFSGGAEGSNDIGYCASTFNGGDESSYDDDSQNVSTMQGGANGADDVSFLESQPRGVEAQPLRQVVGSWGCNAPENIVAARAASAAASGSPAGHLTETYLLGLLNTYVKSGKFVPFNEYDPLPAELYEFIPDKARVLLEAGAPPGATRDDLVRAYNARIAEAGQAKRAGTMTPEQEEFYRSAAHLTFDGWIPEQKLAFEYNGEYHYWPSGAELARICGSAQQREQYLRRVRAEVERDERKRRIAHAAGYRLILIHCTVPRAAFCDYVRSRLADFDAAREPPKTYFHPIPEPEIRKIDEAERIVASGKVSRADLAELRAFVEDIKSHQTKVALEHIMRLHGASK